MPRENNHLTGLLSLNSALRITRLAAVLPAIVGAGALPCFGQSRDDHALAPYFQGLRERGLFRLAEAYCKRRLAHDELPDRLRTILTVELVATLTEHGESVVGAEQAELWHEARQAIARYVERSPGGPGRVVVDAYAAMVSSAAGRSLRWESQLRPDDAGLAQAAIRNLRDAVSQLSASEQKLRAVLGREIAAVNDGEEEPSFDLRLLIRRLRTNRGEAWLDLAELAPETSEARVTAATEARKVFLAPDPATDDDLAWRRLIGLASASRLAGDPNRATTELHAIEKRAPARDAFDRLLAEKLRGCIASHRFHEAQVLLDERRHLAARVPGELLFLAVDSTARQWQHQADAKSAGPLDSLLPRLEELAALAHREVGGIWAYRADLVVERMRETARYGPELASLARRAQAEFQRGRLSESSALYGKASDMAHTSGQEEPAFRFGFTSASIDMQAKEFEVAASKLLELVAAQPRNAQAGEAHLLAAYALGRLYDGQPTLARRDEFARALEDHRSRFTDPKTVGEATWLLGELSERRGQLTTALALYREVPWEHTRSSPALAATARCYEKMLDRLRRADEPSLEWEREAIESLQEALPSSVGPTQGMNVHQVEAAVRFSRILLTCQPPRFSVADRWLLRALASAGPPPNTPDPARDDPVAEWRATALQLRIVSLAGQEQYPQARKQLEQIGETRPAELLRILKGLALLSAEQGRDPLNDLGALRLEAALRLADQRDSLTAADRRRLDECLAQAYVSTGDAQRGIDIYEALLKEFPRDAALLEEYARLQSKINDGRSVKIAAAAWKRLETLYAPGSDAWLAARCELCRCLQKQGESAEACKLLQVTRLLYPQLGGAELERQFAELESRCANARP